MLRALLWPGAVSRWCKAGGKLHRDSFANQGLLGLVSDFFFFFKKIEVLLKISPVFKIIYLREWRTGTWVHLYICIIYLYVYVIR